jgi:serine/threonine protein kinase/Tol biopolymer transport system component
MSLAPGTRFGTFEVVSLLGAGGMGEVYRAVDTRLHREVALKVVPGSLAQDPERLARLTREAQVLASLNHPNVGAIHGLEDVAGRPVLVLELVEGPTLADRIAQGAIPLEEALSIARQIAEALEAAHEQGIVHRDLKPANIKVRFDGTVKVLDFGLAKALSRTDAGSSVSPKLDVTASPTLLSPATMTSAGIILGTAAYMAPEQARGKPADRRADIWAFGAVLYEMLAGRRAFEGDEVTDTLAGILRGEPSWDALPSSTPSPIRRLLRRCLEKNPRERLQAIGDARIEITDALSRPDVEPAGAVSPATSRTRQLIPVAAACAAAVLLAAVATWALKPAPSTVEARVTRSLISAEAFDHRPPLKPGESRGPIGRGPLTGVALSPDGRTLVYRGIATDVNPGGGTQSVLVVRRLDSLETTLIPTTTGAENPFLSPDGEWIGYWDGGELRRVALAGSTTYTTIARVPDEGRVWGASWGDGDAIVYGTSDGIWRVGASGGMPELVTKAGDSETTRSLPHVLPGGQSILFTRQRIVWRWDDADVLVRSLSTGVEKVLFSDGADARYVSSGHIVFMRRGKLMAVPFDLERLTVTGGAVALVDDVMQAANMGNSGNDTGAGQFAVSRSGTLVYVTGGVEDDQPRELVWVRRDGTVEPVGAPHREFGGPRLSPDGRRIAMFTAASLEDGGNRLWVYDIAQRALTPVTTSDERILWGVWSPDSARLAYEVLLPGRANLSSRAADGTGRPHGITSPGPLNQAPTSWSRDGVLAFVQSGEAINNDIWVVDMQGDSQPRPVVQSDANEQHPTFSPDGKWLAYSSNASGRWDVYVQPYPGPGPRVVVSSGGGIAPAWRGDGGELYYSAPGQDVDVMTAVTVTATASHFSAGPPRPLFPNRFGSTTPARGYDVTPDGQRFLMVRGVDAPPPRPRRMVLVENWGEELRRLAPSSD